MIKNIFKEVKKAGRATLNEFQASEVMMHAGVSMVVNRACKDLEEAEAAAEELGYPVVLKILSPDILHKTDAGCVRVGIKDVQQLGRAYREIMNNGIRYNPGARVEGVLIQEMAPQGLELIIGMKRDPQFGPVIMFGLGGIYVEVFEDISLRLLPVDTREIMEMIQETRISRILEGARGKEYDMDEVVNTLLNISRLVEENADIEEIDINPFFLYGKGKGGKGVDALITLSK